MGGGGEGVFLGPPCYGYAFKLLSCCLFGHTRDTSVIYKKAKFVCFKYTQLQKLKFVSVQINMKQVS